MRGLLVRVGIDHSYGEWNAPVDPESMEFVFVPIPESAKTKFYPKMGSRFRKVLPALTRFAARHGKSDARALRWPTGLNNCYMHLDPDFEYLTYGNKDNAKGTMFHHLQDGDLLVFYAGLRPVVPEERRLIYAIVGLFVVDEVVWARDVPKARWHENAHTRKSTRGLNDVVVRAKQGKSGRLTHCIDIGEYRNRAYRVRRDLIDAWGGLSVNDGYIQRSAVPPRFLDAKKFYRWFLKQCPILVASNIEDGEIQSARRTPKRIQQNRRILSGPVRDRRSDVTPPVIIVHLRQPRQTDPNEKRDDPFYEFGSFGCTGCHGRNLLNPKRAQILNGARLAFAQGGKGQFRLILLTPPVTVKCHRNRCEVQWEPIKPFRFDAAPKLVSNQGMSDFLALADMLREGERPTLCGRFSSAFRSRCKQLPEHVAREMITVFDIHMGSAEPSAFASHYAETMQSSPPRIDSNRRKTYDGLLRQAGGRTTKRRCASRCKRR